MSSRKYHPTNEKQAAAFREDDRQTLLIEAEVPEQMARELLKDD